MITLSDEQQMVVKAARELAESEFTDKAFEWNGDVPWENVELLAEQGYLGISFGTEYGGEGMSELESLLVIEAVARVCPDTALFMNGHNVAPRAIDMFGSDMIKEKYLPGIIDGTDYVAVAMSEPEAGSDLNAMETTIERDGDEVVINGEKIWVSEYPDATAVVVWGKFADGLGTVVVDLDEPGIEVANHFENMAGNVQTQFFLDNARVSDDHVLTSGSDGFRKHMQALNWERLSTAAMTNGIALCALDKALEYGTQREQFGQPVLDFQGIEWKIAEMAKQVETSRAIVHQSALNAVENGSIPNPLESTIAFLHSGEAADHIVDESLQIHGANGYMNGHPLEYLYRMVRGLRIGGGTDEIQRNTIARIVKRDGMPHLA
ncbi:acyl-CoA dehydrogenase family protein [Halosolutus amylolyticus]|uniref:Acyl-CoA dehydrogenase family protein n=1 Tax=Halosolutus amylolyticus TaxID=2932267 RepID=A0ABD5PIQ6_9EURY|nr:acyl-CoA dehydrogenase family protein [Halosolutus amylolyticus]